MHAENTQTQSPASYDEIADLYVRANLKPDKLHSIHPTIYSMAGTLTGMNVLDAGCGSGLFSREFILFLNAQTVYGWDISPEQIALARTIISGCRSKYFNLHYEVRDIFLDRMPFVNLVNAPFVLNYAQDADQLDDLIARFYAALRPGGRLIGTLDLPSGQDLSTFGARKRLLGPAENGTPIEIILFDREGEIMRLPQLARYYSKERLEEALTKAGFTFEWQQPMISERGLEVLGCDFWQGYLENPEIAYVLATKA